MAVTPERSHDDARAYSQEVVQTGLTALAAVNGNAPRATRALAHSKGIRIDPTTLRYWAKVVYPERYQEIREAVAPHLEQRLAQDLLDVAMIATSAQRIAVEAAERRLQADKEDDPARAAANLSKVGHAAIERMLGLTGRPVNAKESTDVEGLLRGLVAVGILKPPDEPKQVEATVEEDDGGEQ
jgi:hypothetical protein